MKSFGVVVKFIITFLTSWPCVSCLLQLIVLWHLSKATRVFLLACVHYNHKWIANLVIDFQISSSEVQKTLLVDLV